MKGCDVYLWVTYTKDCCVWWCSLHCLMVSVLMYITCSLFQLYAHKINFSGSLSACRWGSKSNSTSSSVNYYRSIVDTKSIELQSLQMLIMSPLNMKVHNKRCGLGHEWWFMASLQNGNCNRWQKKCLKLAALPWNRAHSSLSIPKTSMPLVWIGQRRSRKSTERYFSCSWRCSFTSSFTHLWALLLRIAHS